EYRSLNDERFYVTHGDFFDSVTMTKRWLAILGDLGYDFLLHVNQLLGWCRKKLNYTSHWSLSKYVKDNVKSSVSFITDFEQILSEHAKRNNYDGVICGHIHKAEIRQIDGIFYLNCGDWVESCTAIVETLEGEFKVIHWLED
nr:UDP-2,3-diacylglucosamine diphosphatase [Campylobacteraceae bacterium]